MLSASLQHVEHYVSRQLAHKGLNALITPAASLAGSPAAQSGSDRRPLQDRLVSLKDNIATGSAPTTCGSRTLSEYVPGHDSTVARLLVEAGATLGGKTNMDEFGMGSHSQSAFQGPVQSPFGSGLTPGGSSGGAAVTVATGQVDAAIGTDTGGSVRLPAAWTGTVGFKPSYGRISRWGVVDYANSLDTVGIIAADVAQTRAVAEVLDKEDGQDATCLSRQSRSRISEAARTWQALRQKRRGGKLRIGVPIEYNVHGLQAEVKGAWVRLLDKLQDEGHEVVPVSLPSTNLALGAYYILAPAEASSNLAKYDGIRYGFRADAPDELLAPVPSSSPAAQAAPASPTAVLYSQTRGLAFGPEVQRRILLGTYTLSSAAHDNYFLQAQRVRRLVQREYNAVFRMPHPLRDAPPETAPPSRGVDVLVAPTAPTLPLPLEEMARQTAVERYVGDVLTVPASLAGLPALNVPVPLVAGEGWRKGSAGAEGQRVEGEKWLVDSVGLQVIGQYGDDGTVLDVGSLIETLYR